MPVPNAVTMSVPVGVGRDLMSSGVPDPVPNKIRRQLHSIKMRCLEGNMYHFEEEAPLAEPQPSVPRLGVFPRSSCVLVDLFPKL